VSRREKPGDLWWLAKERGLRLRKRVVACSDFVDVIPTRLPGPDRRLDFFDGIDVDDGLLAAGIEQFAPP
jgi:hypothetical protein